MQLFKILNTADSAAPERRIRTWVPVGESFLLCGTLLIPLIGASGEIWLQMFMADGEEVGAIPVAPMTFEPDAPYRVVPRALRIHPNGRPEAVLIETQYTGTDRPVWDQPKTEDENALKDLQPISSAS